MKTPYDHQEKCLLAIFRYFETQSGNPVAVLPVGAGKSLVQEEVSRRLIRDYPHLKIAIVTHVSELLLQIHEEFLSQWPDANVSFYADKLGHKNLSGQIILATIQSIYKKGLLIPGGLDLLIIDECHLLSPKEETSYQTFIKDLKTVNPKLKILGVTGTNFRANTGLLTEGEGKIFTDVAYQIPMLDLINKGFLCPLITPQEPIKTKMSVEGVKTRAGDYVESQLQAAVDKEEITKACVDEIIEHGKARKKWLIFTAGVDHCKHVTDELKARGINCEMVVGTTPTAERSSIVNRYKNGDIQALVCVACFTTGFNNPAIDMLVFMRPTKSPVLYVQMCGRAVRTYKDKIDALVLDFGNVIGNLGPVDTIDARILSKSKNPGEAPVKICPKCHAVNFAGTRECLDCGFPFPFDDSVKLQATASDAAILSSQQKPLWHKVIATQYSRHKGKDGKRDTFRAKYTAYGVDYNDFVCFEHLGFPREKACQWHKRRLPNLPVPYTIDKALSLPYPRADEILVQMQGKYGTVIDVKFHQDGLADILPPTPIDNNILAEIEDIPFD